MAMTCPLKEYAGGRDRMCGDDCAWRIAVEGHVGRREVCALALAAKSSSGITAAIVNYDDGRRGDGGRA